jgi:hypothetical protein
VPPAGSAAGGVCSCSSRIPGWLVLTGSGMKRSFAAAVATSALAGGVLGLECSEEFVHVSQPEEPREDTSPSRASASREEDREVADRDVPVEQPREEPLPDFIPRSLTSPWGLSRSPVKAPPLLEERRPLRALAPPPPPPPSAPGGPRCGRKARCGWGDTGKPEPPPLRAGNGAAADPPEVLTEPSGCCTHWQTSLQFLPPWGAVPDRGGWPPTLVFTMYKVSTAPRPLAPAIALGPGNYVAPCGTPMATSRS